MDRTSRSPSSRPRSTRTASRSRSKEYSFPRRTRLLVRSGDTVEQGDPLNEGSLNPAELLDLHTRAARGSTPTELYLVGEVQKVYKSQGVDIHDKHIELIVRQMMKKVRVETAGRHGAPSRAARRPVVLERANDAARAAKGEEATFEPLILGITKASLATESFLSAASFQETTKVLTDAAIEGKIDRLLGLKENVIIGKLIPAATGLKKYRGIDIEPSEPLPARDVRQRDRGRAARRARGDRRTATGSTSPRSASASTATRVTTPRSPTPTTRSSGRGPGPGADDHEGRREPPSSFPEGAFEVGGGGIDGSGAGL